MASKCWRFATAALVIVSTLALVRPADAAPGASNTTLTINKGGDRTASQIVAGLAGATFDFYAGTRAGPPPAPGSSGSAGSCVTDAAGQCSVDLPGRTAGTGAQTQGYWIVERSAPAGFSAPGTLDLGAPPMTSTQYNGIFTGHVNDAQAYSFPAASTDNDNLQARGSVMADIRDNPGLPDRCGLKIALLMDVSGSITPFLGTVKDAADGFVDALTGTPSSIALYSFSTTATQNLGATSVSDTSGADTVKDAIDGLSAGGGTNWDAGLFQIAASPTTYDAVVMLTDGNPTYYGPNAAGPGSQTRFREIENGIFSANAVKTLGTKVVAVGVGDGISGSADNLKAVSGPVAGSDYVQTGYDELAAVFREIALRACAGTVNVVKKIVPPSGGVADAVPAGGWTFSTDTANVTPASGQTSVDGGALSFSADLNGAASMPVTITEDQQSGFTLVRDGGKNATCTSGGDPVDSTDDGALGFTVDALRNAIVTCTVYNRAPIPLAQVKVDKKWIINGTAYADGAQPTDFQAAPTLTGQDAPVFGATYGGYHEGDDVNVGEQLADAMLPPGCSNEAGGDLGDHTLAAGLNTFEITNKATCETGLTLFKEIVGPDGMDAADPNAWTLNAYPPGSETPVVTGTTGVDGTVEPNVTYALGETTLAGYVQEVVPSATITPPSTGSWHCVLRHRDGTIGPEFDGLNGGVTVELGQHAECTAKNLKLPTLTLRKTVSNTHGGTAEPADWTLNAVPDADGAATISGVDGDPSVTDAVAVPRIAYTLSETGGPGGYEQVGEVACVNDITGDAVVTPGGVLKLVYGDDVTCTFANRDKGDEPTPPGPGPNPPAPPGPELPTTGTRTGLALGAGGLLVTLGAGLRILVRRRTA
ncbi:VWA domain-containing protein [Phytomonospora endophytica]|uniref:VWFA domain-containing protein n=1 Tax=Phytomonospora endophytica TaxID=714109 RepID=A0A841FMC6_9ACTN|nr:VWA domain-containing protein [Phytomonospora endophytica]MBB6036063.1 hypothetical protein [Phytomonospora endophytica]